MSTIRSSRASKLQIEIPIMAQSMNHPMFPMKSPWRMKTRCRREGSRRVKPERSIFQFAPILEEETGIFEDEPKEWDKPHQPRNRQHAEQVGMGLLRANALSGHFLSESLYPGPEYRMLSKKGKSYLVLDLSVRLEIVPGCPQTRCEVTRRQKSHRAPREDYEQKHNPKTGP